MFLFHFLADDEFDELCFEYGIELDEVVSKVTLLTASTYSYLLYYR